MADSACYLWRLLLNSPAAIVQPWANQDRNDAHACDIRRARSDQTVMEENETAKARMLISHRIAEYLTHSMAYMFWHSAIVGRTFDDETHMT